MDIPTTFKCISDKYETAEYKPTYRSENTLAIAAYLNQYYSYSDLKSLEKTQKPEAVGYNAEVVSINGGLNTQDMKGIESDLDLDVATALTVPLNAR